MSGINIGAENKEITATHAACKILSRECNPPMGILIKGSRLYQRW
jgi:importin subunit alpha-2